MSISNSNLLRALFGLLELGQCRYPQNFTPCYILVLGMCGDQVYFAFAPRFNGWKSRLDHTLLFLNKFFSVKSAHRNQWIFWIHIFRVSSLFFQWNILHCIYNMQQKSRIHYVTEIVIIKIQTFTLSENNVLHSHPMMHCSLCFGCKLKLHPKVSWHNVLPIAIKHDDKTTPLNYI